MKPVRTWILIADSKAARVMENCGVGKGLSQVSGKVFRAMKRVGFSDQEGRSFNSGSGAHHKLEPHHGEDPVIQNHVRQIVQSLIKSHQAREFDRLIICAAPATLGLIRCQLPSQLKKLTIAELDKDLTNIRPIDLPDHFKEVLAI